MLQRAEAVRKQTAKQPEGLQGLKGRIAKLRWAGLDQDAEKLCVQLENVAPEDCVPPGPIETD